MEPPVQDRDKRKLSFYLRPCFMEALESEARRWDMTPPEFVESFFVQAGMLPNGKRMKLTVRGRALEPLVPMEGELALFPVPVTATVGPNGSEGEGGEG